MKNIYLCGPTLYNTPHVGNMRPVITFDLYIRALKAKGIKTNFIHNLTDIDDKIIAKAKEEEVTETEVSERYISEYRELLVNYNIVSPDSMPKVTENIKSIIEFINSLIDKGIAYEVNGNVYFSVDKDPKYGSLANRELDAMRFEETKDKKHPGDFALWKTTNEGVQFDSPWDKGRPGWHTECVVFINNELKCESLDIHGGGIDLVFPHHENEAAQYRTLTGNELTKEWKHIGHLDIDGKKMSKSLGNVISATEFADEVGPDVLRMIFLTSNPAKPVKLTEDTIEMNAKRVDNWLKAFNKALLFEDKNEDNDSSTLETIKDKLIKWEFSAVTELVENEVKDFNKDLAKNNVIEMMKLLGFNFTKVEISQEVKDLYKEWEIARENREFNKADELREKLVEYKLI